MSVKFNSASARFSKSAIGNLCIITADINDRYQLSMYGYRLGIIGNKLKWSRFCQYPFMKKYN
jgi:hypothetical protein